jgi:hypothetical protein
VTGPTGPSVTGPTGPQVTGPTGPQVTGPTGAAATGPTGPSVTGPTGPSVTGPTGPGVTGPTGPASTVQGPTGPSGGPTGPTGPSGGPTGPAGTFADQQEINAQTTGYTLSLADAGRLVTISATTGVNVVIPAIASVSFSTGVHVDLLRLGTGPVTVTGATGVTINGTPGRSLRATYSAATCIHYEGDKWVVVGDLS